MKISNNLLAVLLVLSILVSGMSFFGSYTGYEEKQAMSGMSVTSGKTNVSVISSSSITFVAGWNETWFGEGTLNPGSETIIATNLQNNNSFYNGSYCNGTMVPGASGTAVKPLCIENDGNDESTCVKIQASAAPAGWITCSGSCAQTPNVTIRSYENATAGVSCTSGLRSDWGQLNGTDRWLCEAINTTQVIGVDLQLTLPQNTDAGTELSTTITISGTDSC
ncbi:MAG: hypothetical protein JW716_05460 [Candidatus Aenigmarchaeota archaeon]|nr:hypothetical protein [Candidatus Aenigmarchaeota archaeon]